MRFSVFDLLRAGIRRDHALKMRGQPDRRLPTDGRAVPGEFLRRRDTGDERKEFCRRPGAEKFVVGRLRRKVILEFHVFAAAMSARWRVTSSNRPYIS